MSKTDFRNCHENNPFQKTHSLSFRQFFYFEIFFRMEPKSQNPVLNIACKIAVQLTNYRIATTARRAGNSTWWSPNYPKWSCDYTNFKNGKNELVGKITVGDDWPADKKSDLEAAMKAQYGEDMMIYRWVPDVKQVEDPMKAEWDISPNGLRLSHIFGFSAKHYEVFFGLTAVGYILFSLYDYRKQAKQ